MIGCCLLECLQYVLLCVDDIQLSMFSLYRLYCVTLGIVFWVDGVAVNQPRLSSAASFMTCVTDLLTDLLLAVIEMHLYKSYTDI